MRLTRLVPLLLEVAVLAGCTSVVAGTGTVAPSVSPSAGLPGVPPAGAPPQCTGPQPVTVSGAPFCFLTPTGFFNATNAATLPGGYSYKTAVQYDVTGKRDLISVEGRRAGVDATTYPDSELLSLMSDSIRLGGSNIVASTPPTALRVSGYRAVQSELRFADGVRKRYVLLFVGYVRVSVSCQWQMFRAQIAAGCASVLASLRVGS